MSNVQKLDDKVITTLAALINEKPEWKKSLEEWFDFILNYNDIFSRDYIGYWAQGSRPVDGKPVRDGDKVTKEGRWLLMDHEDETALGELNRKTLTSAYVYGVLQCGQFDWYSECASADAHTYDFVIQMALFGTLVYG